ncbi:hypothetical protein KPSA1_03859 [Pseudomonas syringae pv. actinidiae]|uniref:Uncharacterized protein n=1 Tax=Pseudomonas syringae pv. actinidiae TaxID=103796 RepID=A0A2V0QMH5_PSESF|nr:hypothetical protein KPSA1_03859 [Pseudomonas syringae pv. actinidiae]
MPGAPVLVPSTFFSAPVPGTFGLPLSGFVGPVEPASALVLASANSVARPNAPSLFLIMMISPSVQ